MWTKTKTKQKKAPEREVREPKKRLKALIFCYELALAVLIEAIKSFLILPQ